MFSAKNIAMNMIASNPVIANNPQAREYIQIIQNGDSQKGQKIADNICATYGVSREEAVKKARQMFGLSS